MYTGTHTVEVLFGHERRYVVPLFQRPYVWNRDEQWQPLLDDLLGLAERMLDGWEARPHFLGAIVLEDLQQPTGQLESRLVIDGQQRLTTVAVLLKAFHDVCVQRGDGPVAKALHRLARNEDPLNESRINQYKVWPTNADRDHFEAVMVTTGPDVLAQQYGREEDARSFDARLADAYAYFFDRIEEWLDKGDGEGVSGRARQLLHAIREKLRLVVIDLGQEDDPQVIFETLNARGTPLLPTDLVKNHLFREIREDGDSLEALYESHWRDFDDESGWWRELVGPGHAQRARVDIFLGHYVTARRRTSIATSRLYDAFKDLARHSGWSAEEHLSDIRQLIGRIVRPPREYDRLGRGKQFGGDAMTRSSCSAADR